MSLPHLALIFLVLWCILLLGAIGAYRVALVHRGAFESNGFSPGVPHGPNLYWRLNRAHLNAVENLPLIATIVLVGSWVEIQTEPFSQLAVAYACARVIQTIAHVSSGTKLAVGVRFSAFAAQLCCLAWMAYELLGASTA